MAVKITLVPEQIVDALAAIFTEGITAGVTVTVTVFEAAVVVVVHNALEVNTHDTTSLSDNELFE